MEKHIIGAYDSTNEAAAVVDQLSRKGYSPEEIMVVSNREQLGSLEDRTGLDIKREDTDTERHDESMWDKIKDAFTMDEDTHSKGRLSKYDLSDEDTRQYESELADGKILIAVESDSGIDTEEFRDVSYRDDRETTDFDRRGADTMNESNEEQSMELHEERLNVDKHERKTGEVSVHKEVAEEERSVDVPVRHEEVYVEKRHVNDGETRNTSTQMGDDDEIRIPVVEEKVEVKKKPVVTDEVVVGKRTTEETEHVSDTVKKEEVHLDKDGSSVRGEDTLNKDRYDNDMRRDGKTDRFATGQSLQNGTGADSESERRDYKNTKNLDDQEGFKRNDYRGDM